MTQKKDFTFEISISERAYSAKPNSEDYKRMKFHKVVVNAGMFMEYIKQGYSYCHVYKNNHRSNADFLYTYFVNIDIDDSPVPMKQAINHAVMKPTLAYTTFSNKKNGLYSYRFIYCFSEQIDSQTYVPLYKWVCAYAGMANTKDNCGRVLSQLMNGNSLSDIETYLSYRIYRISDFSQNSHLHLYCNDSIVYNSKRPNCKNSSVPVNREIVSDLNRLELPEFLIKYASLGIVEQTELDYNERGYGLIPDTFMKVYNRISWASNRPHINRFKDGENRRKRLYVDACVIRKIEPEISFDKMLYNLVWRRKWFYDNSDHVLTNDVLIEKTKYVMALPLSDLDTIKSTKHGKFTTSKDYCAEHNLKRRNYARTV